MISRAEWPVLCRVDDLATSPPAAQIESLGGRLISLASSRSVAAAHWWPVRVRRQDSCQIPGDGGHACTGTYTEQLDEDGQFDFKGKAKPFARTYSFLAAILPYTNASWEKLSIFLNFLI